MSKEGEALELAQEGYTVEDITRELSITRKTVYNYVPPHLRKEKEDSFRKKVGCFLRDFRTVEAEVFPEDVTESANISRKRLSEIEDGTVDITLEEALKLAKVLKLDIRVCGRFL